MRRWLAGLALAAWSALAAPAVAHAEDAHAEDARIAAARAAFRDQEQERSLALLGPALAGPLTDHERAAALRLAGCAAMVIGDRAEARAHFIASFALEPDAALEPDLASPDARSLFELAHGEWRAGLVIEMERYAAAIRDLRLDVVAPARAPGGRPLVMEIRVFDPTSLASRVELSYRRRGQPSFITTTRGMIHGGTARFEVPAELTESAHGFSLDYHVTLRHASGFDLRRLGDADHPRSIGITAGHVPRWHESWWVRAAIGVGILGLGVSGYLLYRSRDVGPETVVVHP